MHTNTAIVLENFFKFGLNSFSISHHVSFLDGKISVD